MVWIKLHGSQGGQVLKGIKLKCPHDGLVYEVFSSKRLGINHYLLKLTTLGKPPVEVTNHDLRRDKWLLEGSWHSPEYIATLYKKKIDLDSNKPRPMRESFWRMQSKPGTINYKQKKRIMQLPEYQCFSEYFDTTCASCVGSGKLRARSEVC